jgi:hypothetical protein
MPAAVPFPDILAVFIEKEFSLQVLSFSHMGFGFCSGG